MNLTETQVMNALESVREGQLARAVIETAAKRLVNQISRFKVAHEAEWDRVYDHQHETLGNRAEDWPNLPIFATDRFHSASIRDNAITITTEDRFPGDTYYYHTFTVPVGWLSATPEWIETQLTAQLAEAVATVDAYEEGEEEKAKAERRAQFEALKEEFGS